MKYRCSKKQLKVLNRKIVMSEALGDWKTLLKGQALRLILATGASIKDAAMAVSRSEECVRLWLQDFLVKGCQSIKVRYPKGRQAKLSKTQRLELASMLEKSPTELGFACGCWNSGMISILIESYFGVVYSVKYIPELMKRLGFSWQKGSFESALADAKVRAEWLSKTWPAILKLASSRRSYLLFGDETSFAMWGSLSYTWAPKGKQPKIKTLGKRKCYKMFGMIDYFSGKLFYNGVVGQLNAESYLNFLGHLKSMTRKHLIIIQDGASYHKDANVKDFFESEDRFTVFQLPTYSPDFNPIEKLWKKVKTMASHMIYFEDFDQLVIRVEATMQYFSERADEVMKVFGKFKKLEAASAKA